MTAWHCAPSTFWNSTGAAGAASPSRRAKTALARLLRRSRFGLALNGHFNAPGEIVYSDLIP
jgi:hypothetical protein